MTSETYAAPSFSLKDKVIVITGATGVLGKAFAESVASAGGISILLGRNEAVAQQRVQDIEAHGHKAFAYAVDVLNPSALQEVANDICSRFGGIDGLVNAAGGNQPGAVVMPDQDIFDTDVQALRQVLDLNLMGTVQPTLVFGKKIRERGKGSIVNISSMAAQRALTRVLGYSMAKAGVDGFTRWMAAEMGLRHSAGVRVNAIAPGFFLADQNRALLLQPDGTPTARGQAVLGRTPFSRFGEPEELTGALVWLLSDASSFVTGQIIGVDGGFSAWCGV